MLCTSASTPSSKPCAHLGQRSVGVVWMVASKCLQYKLKVPKLTTAIIKGDDLLLYWGLTPLNR